MSGVLLAATSVVDSIRVFPSLDEKNSHEILTEVHGSAFSLDSFLENPEITLTSGKTLMVILGETLETRLLDEQKLPAIDRKVTKAFAAYFEKTKSTRVFDEVIGFCFLITSGTEEIYSQTFLGENAE